MDKYHEAINLAIKAIKSEIRLIKETRVDPEVEGLLAKRWEAITRLGEIQDLMLPVIAQLKQSLKELDLEGK